MDDLSGSSAGPVHQHYMRLALAQARRATKLPTNFRVGAVLVDGRRLVPTQSTDGSDLDKYVLTTGFTGELPGNTHAEECALEKYAQEIETGDSVESSAGESNELIQSDEIDDRVGLSTEYDMIDRPDPFSSSSSSNTTDSDDDGQVDPDQPVFSPQTVVSPASGISRSRRLSLSSATACGAAEAAECAAVAARSNHPIDLVLYTTMEPCSRRLSGREPCVSRLLRANFKPDGGSKECQTSTVGNRRSNRRKITHVFVGVKEPADFVENNTGREKLDEAGIHYVIVAGLEEQILKVATT